MNEADKAETTGEDGRVQVVIHNHPEQRGWVRRWFVRTLLIVSLLVNAVLYTSVGGYFSQAQVWEQFRDGDLTASAKIAVVPIKGLITSDSVRQPIKELKHAAEDAAVKAIVLEIDTPGGTLSASDELYHAVVEFKRTSANAKPVVAFLKGMATSGGYYVAVASDKIVAERSTMTGSIGVIVTLFHGEKLLEKVGVAPEVVKSGAMKDSGSMYRVMTDAERREWQRMVNGMYRQFLDVVLKHRGELVGGEDKLRPLADGRVLSADDALNAKLIDSIGYEIDAYDAAKRLAALTGKTRVIDYSRPTMSLSSLLLGKAPTAPPGVTWKQAADALTPQLMLMPGWSPAWLLSASERTTP